LTCLNGTGSVDDLFDDRFISFECFRRVAPGKSGERDISNGVPPNERNENVGIGSGLKQVGCRGRLIEGAPFVLKIFK
jgi:hypothetical protein